MEISSGMMKEIDQKIVKVLQTGKEYLGEVGAFIADLKAENPRAALVVEEVFARISEPIDNTIGLLYWAFDKSGAREGYEKLITKTFEVAGLRESSADLAILCVAGMEIAAGGNLSNKASKNLLIYSRPISTIQQGFLRYGKEMRLFAGTDIKEVHRLSFVKEAKQGIKSGAYSQKLSREDLKAHKEIYEKSGGRKSMIEEYENINRTSWPQRVKVDKNGNPQINPATGNPVMERAQVHHIIPQEYGGPHNGWNALPVFGNDHQVGIHRSQGALRGLFEFIKKQG
jgi:hypothetical protein